MFGRKILPANIFASPVTYTENMAKVHIKIQ